MKSSVARDTFGLIDDGKETNHIGSSLRAPVGVRADEETEKTERERK